MATPALIETEKLSKTFSREGVQQHVLRNLDLTIRQGDFTVIMGASGAGKSTLLYALSGMDTPTLGDVRFQGRSLAGLSQSALARFRRRACGFVFQQIHLLETLSLFDNAMAAGLLVSKDRAAVARRAEELFAQVGIDQATWRKLPAQTSGGEAQRAAVVRALVNSPAALFADEPTGALDQTSGTAVLDALTAANQGGQSVVLVTHDLKSARRGDRVLYLSDGQIAGELDLRAISGGANAPAGEGHGGANAARGPGGAETVAAGPADARGSGHRPGSGPDAARAQALRSFLIDQGW
ncbi:MAG: ABC transporter ATP-binding protein [Bifidobacteriaceae bacterium]|nr:ABC transporter ATP-binding protein [Bifidobacteriaceae bacterium]